MEDTTHAHRHSLRLAAFTALLWLSAGVHGQGMSPPRPLPAEVKADVDAIAGHLTQVNDTGQVLVCAKAADNARYGVETMLEVGEKNLRAGYMTQAAYNAMAPALRSLLGALSVQDCEAATGTRRDFYQCMSSDYNHVLACGKAHPFEP